MIRGESCAAVFAGQRESDRSTSFVRVWLRVHDGTHRHRGRSDPRPSPTARTRRLAPRTRKPGTFRSNVNVRRRTTRAWRQSRATAAPFQSRRFPGSCSISTPQRSLRGKRGGVQDDIACQFQKVRVLLDEDGFEAALEQMPHAPMSAVETLRVEAVELAHAARQRGIGRLNKKVVVISHEDIGVKAPADEPDRTAENSQELEPIGVCPRKISRRCCRAP